MTMPEKFQIDGPVPFSGVCGSLDADGVIDLEVWNENANYSGSDGLAFLTLTADQAEALGNWLLSAAAYRRSLGNGL